MPAALVSTLQTTLFHVLTFAMVESIHLDIFMTIFVRSQYRCRQYHCQNSMMFIKRNDDKLKCSHVFYFLCTCHFEVESCTKVSEIISKIHDFIPLNEHLPISHMLRKICSRVHI